MALIVPLQPVPSQTLTISLGGQAVQVSIRQKSTGLYADVSVNNKLVVGGALCLNATPIVRSGYLGFVGELRFVDMQGKSDPTYDGLGSRFPLVYTGG